MTKHVSVLTKEVLAQLAPIDNGIYIDATFGAGGHSRALLSHNPKIKVIALDWDKKSIDTYAPELQAEFGSRFQVVWSNFAHIFRVAKKLNLTQVDGILADFGTSMMHFTQREGFSFSRETELDMRMSPAHQKTTAKDIVNFASVQELTAILHRGGEERFAYAIAKAIADQRKRKKIETTIELAHIVESVRGKKKHGSIHPATQTFQAIRIAVNKELENIHAFLINSLPLLKKGGRIACISFHSLEDREVKEFFHQKTNEAVLTIITKKAITASDEEIAQNPSSRSAKLRVAEKR
jgi:16S rRNA (cytosine1402-N4)-methyltransferase